MALLAGRSKTERNKLIAAALLGVLSLTALYFAFGRSLFAGPAPTAKATPTPKTSSSPASDKQNLRLPSASEQDLAYQSTPIDYRPGNAYAPDAGRNIFGFYEPPPPTPWVPTPTPPPPPAKTPEPTPTPEMTVGFMMPQTVYAGQRAFRLEVNGDRFTPDARIYFSQSEIPTTFINAQKLVADIPANFIAQEGPRQIIVQTPDGKQYSNQAIFQVQAPPRPTMQFIGVKLSKLHNNDTATFLDTGKTTPYSARLNDVLGGRFRLVNITPLDVTFEDTSLGFRHKVAMAKPSSTGTGAPAGRPGTNPSDPNFQPFNPGNLQPDCPPGIPCNIPRYVPPQPQRPPNDPKKDVDDDGDG